MAERAILHRIVYAAGDPTLAGSVRFHPSLVAAGLAALHAGATIITDVRMVEVALDRTRAAALSCATACAIAAPGVAAAANAQHLPRAAVAMTMMGEALNGSVVVIGNAPTALLSLLDMVDAGEAHPALIIGMPVGFVAAAESKAELMQRDIPYITIEGNRGGSAVAAAAANALLRLAHPE